MNLTTKLVIILAVLLSIVIGGVVIDALAEIDKNYGMVKATYPNGIKPMIPQGLGGIVWESEYKKGTDEYIVDYCNWLYPLPCDSLD